jgi:hypothetical protein
MFYNFTIISKFDPFFKYLEKCKGIMQRKDYHPEGDVLGHSMQVLSFAFRESNDIDLIMAAMLHDIGKCIDGHGHEKYSADLLKEYISEKTKWLILNHIRFWSFILGDMKKLSKVKKLGTHEWLPDLVMLARWDKAGRNPNKNVEYDRLEILGKLRKLTGEE